jgi:hypothetical protein
VAADNDIRDFQGRDGKFYDGSCAVVLTGAGKRRDEVSDIPENKEISRFGRRKEIRNDAAVGTRYK